MPAERVALAVVFGLAALAGLAFAVMLSMRRQSVTEHGLAAVAVNPRWWVATLTGRPAPPSPTGPFAFRCGSFVSRRPSYLVAFDQHDLVLVRGGSAPAVVHHQRAAAPRTAVQPGPSGGMVTIGVDTIDDGPVGDIARYLAWCGWPVDPPQPPALASSTTASTHGWTWPTPHLLLRPTVVAPTVRPPSPPPVRLPAPSPVRPPGFRPVAPQANPTVAPARTVGPVHTDDAPGERFHPTLPDGIGLDDLD